MDESTSEVEKTFSWRNHRDAKTHHCEFHDLYYGEDRVCEYVSWAFTSCAIDAFQRLNYDYYGGEHLRNAETVKKMVKWLDNNQPPESGGWRPREWYFLISTVQKKYLEGLLSHPNLREVDRFTNKAHGPNDIHLYRLSLEEDFPILREKND